MWQKTLEPHIQAGRVAVIGVVQEQHPDRAKLYRQWRELDWPIYVDALNLLDLAVVPVPVAIDESGIVRHERIDPQNIAGDFLDRSYPPAATYSADHRADRPDIESLAAQAEHSPSATAWRNVGDACFLFGGCGTGFQPVGNRPHAVDAYEKAVALDNKDGRAQFRLGVALRQRHESDERQAGDAQSAVAHWGLALAIDPNQYIWRRRIQQYGPRLDKPYNFYFWVAQARKDILARGDQPVPLACEPVGSEIAAPVKAGVANSAAVIPNPDPQGRINRDSKGLVQIDPVVTPARVRPGHRVRVRVNLRLNEKTKPLWNNEADDLTLSIHLPASISLVEGKFTFPNPKRPETREQRLLEFELAVGDATKPGHLAVPAYVLYYVCEKAGGKCFYLRQDFEVSLTVDPNAVKIQ